MIYVFDYLMLDSTLYFSKGCHHDNVLKWFRVDRANNALHQKTRLLIVFQDKLLLSDEEKKRELSKIETEGIESLTCIEPKMAIELYGEKGKYGALIVKLKDGYLIPDSDRSYFERKQEFGYNVDYLNIDNDSVLYNSIGLDKNMKVTLRKRKNYPWLDLENRIIYVKTKYLIVLNDKLLLSDKEKEQELSVLSKDDIKSITKIDADEAKHLYGKKGKHGALIIELKKE
ncbi:hypothetical protein LJC06_04335 [Bacteroidales bacterium OttesenSCG-928-I14]|nr:hypothetical protein [Bacteroidales bacterium OttesenSCG-928-I14]